MPFKVHIGFLGIRVGNLKAVTPYIILSGLASLPCPVRAIKGS